MRTLKEQLTGSTSLAIISRQVHSGIALLLFQQVVLLALVFIPWEHSPGKDPLLFKCFVSYFWVASTTSNLAGNSTGAS